MNINLFDSDLEVNPSMLILARESRGITQKQLAEMTGISQANISKYENGLYSVSREHLEKIAQKLHYRASFFENKERVYGLQGGILHHRRRQTIPTQELKKWQARANILRMQTARLLLSVDVQSVNQFPRFDIEEEDKTPEEIARRVREMWKLPSGPLTNIVQVVEDAGGIVFRLPFGTKKIDAMIHAGGNTPPIFFANSESPTDRFRFSMAHEIGHFVMHHIPTENSECEADRFAAEFLMPSHDIKPYLTDLSLPKLIDLKAYWRVSMQAIIRRAKDLDVISESKYRQLLTKLSGMGYRTKEPLELSPEEPTIMSEIVRSHFLLGYSTEDLSGILDISESEFNSVFDPKYKGMTLIKGKPGFKKEIGEQDLPQPTRPNPFKLLKSS